ncbi:MAG: (2Fe-2S)-binding protein [Nitrososphaerota archaeon]|nr:(2Fe-2S)-binding protein [Nitrososphaerota archaeon]
MMSKIQNPESLRFSDVDSGAACLHRISLRVNGKLHEISVASHWTLQQVLRDVLGFTSVKDMCLGHGACGSCTVLLDGKPVLSCLTLALDCDGKNVETAEGIEVRHPLVEAFIKLHAFQCGYCTPGFVVTAKALLDRKKDLTVEDVVEALSGNICRCGTYPVVVNAVLEVAEKLRKPGVGGEVGSP